MMLDSAERHGVSLEDRLAVFDSPFWVKTLPGRISDEAGETTLSVRNTVGGRDIHVIIGIIKDWTTGTTTAKVSHACDYRQICGRKTSDDDD